MSYFRNPSQIKKKMTKNLKLTSTKEYRTVAGKDGQETTVYILYITFWFLYHFQVFILHGTLNLWIKNP